MNASPVIVYPTHVEVAPSEPEPDKLADTGAYWRDGQRVTWRYTSGEHESDCAYCQDGRCEQRVESCGAWKADVVIHDRPRCAQ